MINQIKRFFNFNGLQQKDFFEEEIRSGKIDSESDKYEILKKMLYINYEGKKEKFSDHFKDEDGDDVLYEDNKYLDVAQSVYDTFGIDEYIENLQIIADKHFDNAGTTMFNIVNDTLKITISISSIKLGIVNHSEYRHQYTDENLKIFIDVFAHELFHAKNSVEIVKHYGINEYKKIKECSIAKIAWFILDEYSACKATAEQYNSFISFEDVVRNLNSPFFNLTNELKKTDVSKIKLEEICVNLNYAIATRCAFADVSGDEKRHLQLDKLSERQLSYVASVRKLLMDYNSQRPLSYEKYEELGVSIIRNILTNLHGVENDNLDYQISKFT
ncbi:hypothetical protein [Paenibacillus sp. FSL R5-0912]|uniref:hypothetical protein n=1 Tax=Paenibacillus sp. FSL R5-0912 TaxID=1536771 RepID=UPI0004F72097|nr:hypothetical protein [Paenibacillus sp. FSL R5-0912]AIQ40312.1 hypothetical protein R50912_09960 [Paenibacillus sp. FSL R5-0912]